MMPTQNRILQVAILGATSHVAKGLICFLGLNDQIQLYLYARFPERVNHFISQLGYNHIGAARPIQDFGDCVYDAVINCVGCGDPGKLKENINSIFEITEQFDDLVLSYIKIKASTVYINFSSGAVFGEDFVQAIEEQTKAVVDINNLKNTAFYGLAKIYSEAKHRALSGYSIIDIRIFSYFSRFISLETKFFITEIIRCIREKKTFITDETDIIRDYIHPSDLSNLVYRCLLTQKTNDVFDAYSAHPVSKFQVLDYFRNRYDLEYQIIGTAVTSPTGVKNNYYSKNKKAIKIGYQPTFTSLECLDLESEALINF